MKIAHLVENLRDVAVSGPLDGDVGRVDYDSRQVEPGSLYCALKGQKSDGLAFVDRAVEAGATAVLADALPTHAGVAWLRSADPRRSMAEAADLVCGSPSHRLRLAGVTGTNGKTTTAFLIHHLLRSARHRAGLIGTVHHDDGVTEGRSSHTTPESPDLQRLLARMVHNGCGGAAMEVSSHALVQQRVHRIEFDAAVFTNLTQDHLDFHQTMEEYFHAKERLFEALTAQREKTSPVAVINGDDPYGRRLVNRFQPQLKVVRYGMGVQSDFRASNVKFDFNGTSYQLEVGERRLLVRLPLIGRFNVYNSLAALAAAQACGLNLREAVTHLARAPQIPGRLESVAERRHFRVFVDYAHTPDALENALTTLRELSPSRLIVIFGCGGDRDRDKRPKMAAVADRLADFTIITSDNPRSEDPAAIIADISRGFHRASHSVIEDRREAIGHAIEHARPGDIILIAGKGHEDYQIFADRTISFDDRKVARQFLQEKVSPPPATRR